jgi:hypothetical protein
LFVHKSALAESVPVFTVMIAICSQNGGIGIRDPRHQQHVRPTLPSTAFIQEFVVGMKGLPVWKACFVAAVASDAPAGRPRQREQGSAHVSSSNWVWDGFDENSLPCKAALAVNL